ncbi:hypothetical protein BDP27DRAFT_1425109 [Rhodocollybia butyracea]|uniref:F-box domain-containing protein n=1 Tax=Rhodocollybia butyracea TaxID=206335 RepID=A0A9P5PKR4_9AGAR|nr:hypothetical protein BDP27DRAFT_1425109 [Rhodocollybia butyracea]
MSFNVDARSTSESSQPDPLLLVYQKDFTETLTKIRSNFIPSSSDEKAELHAYIVRARKDLDSCEDDTIRAHISKTLELKESLLAPIRALPSEILNEIFQFVVYRRYSSPDLEPGIRYIVPEEAIEPMEDRMISGTTFLLTWVCIRWQNEALSQPAFWSCIHVQFRYKDPQHSSEVLEFLKACILCSRSYAPMNVRIDLDYAWYAKSQVVSPAHLDVLEMLLESADRWRTLILNGRAHFPIQFVDLLDAKHALTPSVPLFPHLEDLKLNLRRYNPPNLGQMFRYFPPVQSLDIPSLFETDAVNFELLLKLRVRVYNGHSLAGLLRKCPSLKYLKVSCFAGQHQSISDSTTSSTDTQVMSHPLLSTLEVGVLDYNFQHGAWSFVCLPSLTQLDVSIISDEEGLGAPFEMRAPLIELKEMIQRSECTLEKVNLKLPELDATHPTLHSKQPRNFLRICRLPTCPCGLSPCLGLIGGRGGKMYRKTWKQI